MIAQFYKIAESAELDDGTKLTANTTVVCSIPVRGNELFSFLYCGR